MAEEQEDGLPGAGARAGGADPAALSLSLSAADRSEANAYLRDQRRLTALQIEKLAAEEHYERSHLHWRRFNDRMKGALQVIAVLAGIGVIGGFGLLVWNAAHADGYVIESFTVPPDLAERGWTGEVVAGRLLDRLNVITTPGGSSVNAAQAVSANSADDVKVEIPDTGVSLGELYRFLRRYLGNQNQVSGEVVHEGDGLALTVRVNGKDGATYQGPANTLDNLLQKGAEHTYGAANPGGYAAYLIGSARRAEARAVLQRAAVDPALTSLQRASASNELGGIYYVYGNLRAALAEYRRSEAADPTFPLSYLNALGREFEMGHVEAALTELPQVSAIYERNHGHETADAIGDIRARFHEDDSTLHGDYAGALNVADATSAAIGGDRQYRQIDWDARSRALLHDGSALAWLAEQPQPANVSQTSKLQTALQMQVALQHWPGVIALAPELEKAMVQGGADAAGRENLYAVYVYPWLALAKARTGDLAGAEKTIAATPGDCYHCIRVRGLIAAEARQWGRADYWFAKAVHDAPSIPLAHEDWGRSYLARGKPDDAIAQFKLSNQKGPHFADALEGWGEALMAKNRSDLALAKFAEAEKYAPNWGRLHLKWGEALYYAGKKDEAKVQLARAAQLDLTASEKADLARESSHA